jgi:F-type H+-transporting ATPase subunit delta
MASSKIAYRYSKSLFDLAGQNNSMEEVKTDMESLITICKDSRELVNLLKNPIVKPDDKKAVLRRVFSDSSETTLSFLDFMVSKKREAELPLVAEQFINAYDKMNGIAKATVISALPLNDDTIAKVKSYIRGIAGSDDIIVRNEIDSSIIGGIIIKYEDKLLDMSVAKELREIRKELIYN